MITTEHWHCLNTLTSWMHRQVILGMDFPLPTEKIFNSWFSVFAGGHFRLYPYWMSKAGLRQINSRKKPFIFYLHPWEIDPKQPRISASWLSRFRHYNNLDKCESRLKRLLTEFGFSTALDVLGKQGLLNT